MPRDPRMTRCGLGLLVCLVACGGSEGEPKPEVVGPPVSLALREARVGDRVEVELRAGQGFPVDGGEFRFGEHEASASMTTRTHYVDRVCRVEAGRATVVDRQFDGAPQPNEIDLEMHKDHARRHLAMFDPLVPSEPVRVGERWTVEPAPAPVPLILGMGDEGLRHARADCEFLERRTTSDADLAVIGVTLECRLTNTVVRTFSGEIHVDLRLGAIVFVRLATESGTLYESRGRPAR